MGKSHLLGWARATATEAGLGVVDVGCTEGGSTIPLSAARSLAAAVGSTVEGGAERISDAVGAATADGDGLVVLLDDAQWIDSASYPFVLALVDAVVEAPVGLVVAARPPSPTSPPLQRLLATLERRGAPTLHLEALTEEEAVALATDVTAGPLDDDQRSVLAAAAGNPFLVLELAAAWRSGIRPPPESVLLHTMSELSPPARQLLDRACVLGREVHLADLARMAECSAVELVDVVREVVASGLVDGSADRLRFRHDLIREALYSGLPSAVRGAIHLEAAGALEARGALPMELATHLVEGAQAGDAHAVERLRAASAAAAGADAQVAITLLEAARRICADDDVATAIERRLIVLYGWTGRGAEAIALAEPLLARTTDAGHQARLRVSLAEAIALGGAEEAGARVAREALAMPDLPDRIRASLLVIASTGFWASRPERCRELTAEAQVLAGEDPAVRIAAIEHEAASYSAEVSLVAFLERARMGSRLAREADAADHFLAPHRLVWALGNEAEACLANDRVEEGLRLLRESEHRVRRSGLPSGQLAGHCAMRAEGHILLCRWEDASAELDARLEILAEHGHDDTSASGMPTRTISARARIATLTGSRGAAALLDEWTGQAEGRLEQARIALWRCHLAVVDGLAGPAMDAALAVADVVRSLLDDDECAARAFGWTSSWLEVALVLLAGGRTTEADLVTEVMEGPVRANASLARWEADGLVLTAVRMRGRSAPRSATATLAEAVTVADRIESPLPRFRVLSDVAAAARLLGADEIGRRAEDRMSDVATAHGLALPEPGRRPRAAATPSSPLRPTTGWDSLTPSEQRVARLVAEGLGNRAIADELLLSRYTVESHLKRIFQKLHVTSRLKLAAFVIRTQA